MDTNREASNHIQELRKSGATWGEITAELNAKGFKTASGKPFKRSNAISTHAYWSKRGRAGRVYGNDSKVVLALLRAGQLTAEEKLDAIEKYIAF